MAKPRPDFDFLDTDEVIKSLSLRMPASWLAKLERVAAERGFRHKSDLLRSVIADMVGEKAPERRERRR